ncbi:O-antigen ligase family protein [Geminicoccus roseus]|uniref:O-antigen ligase family protein n=1 Tax=Geminicoccus roseus TaxID=404900 RepID=UPI000425AB5B|nr:O-antigen ligase family protein [Geminicoccus roseus]
MPSAPSTRRLASCLLVLLAALAMLSADQAARLGITALRMPVFLLVVLALVALGLSVRPRIGPAAMRAPALLLLLAAAMALIDLQGPVDPLDYKLLLPVLALFAAGPVAAALGPLDLPRLLWRLTALYVLATALAVVLLGPAELAKGAEGIARIDASGSLVIHASFCTLHLALAAATWRRTGAIGRLLRLVAGAGALLMLLLAATRTPFLALAITAALLVAASPGRAAWTRRLVLAGLAGTAFLALHTTLIDDSLWRRLVADGQPEWSTGRAVAVQSWLERADGHPFGLGLGAVRSALAEGKPHLDGQAILDWPHNEAVRLWVEAGPVGLAFLLVLLGAVVGRAMAVAKAAPPGGEGLVALVLAGDAIAQSLLQNWLNGVYHATFAVLLVGLLAGEAPNRHGRATSGLSPHPAPA